MPAKTNGMTTKDKAFAHGLIQGKTVVSAAMDAGFAKSTAYKVAHTWIGKTRKTSQKPELFDYVQEKRKELEAEFTVTDKEVLRGFHRIASADIRQLFDENGHMRPVHTLPDDIVAAIVGIEVVEETTSTGKTTKTVLRTKKVKLATDRNAAWANIARMLGYNEPDKMNVTGSFLDFLKKTSQGGE